MTRYAAFLRGVMPTNAKMPELKKCFESAGFTMVKTVLGSGNVVFSARALPLARLERRAEAVMGKRLGKPFMTIVRPVEELRELLARDPYRSLKLPPDAKRVVTFLRDGARAKLELPITLGGAQIVRIEAGAVFSAYVPGPRGAEFMVLIEKTFGKDVTTRTWETVRRVRGLALIPRDTFE